MPTEITLAIDNVSTHVKRGGSGPPLLYLHGAAGGGGWQRHHELLAESFTVYAPDHPGWGASDDAEEMDTIADYVLHYDSLLRALEVKRPVLVGHSLGGWMAAEFAAAYPDAIAALALVNAAGFPFEGEQLRPVSDFFAAVARGGPELAQLLFHKMDVAAAYFGGAPALEEILERYRSQTSAARITWHIWFERKLPRRLARVSAPSLVLWGEHDGLFPPAVAKGYAAAIPGARLQILPECGHMVPLEDPEALRAAIVDLYGRAG